MHETKDQSATKNSNHCRQGSAIKPHSDRASEQVKKKATNLASFLSQKKREIKRQANSSLSQLLPQFSEKIGSMCHVNSIVRSKKQARIASYISSEWLSIQLPACKHFQS